MTNREITEALKYNGYDGEIAVARGGLVLAFFEATGLEERLTTHPSPGPERQLEFLTGDATCTINHVDVVTFSIVHPPKTKWLGGTWLDTAPLTYLARVCDIGHRLLGQNWTDKIKKRLANRAELLDVLNEVWWLGCLKSVTASPKVDGGGDNDWHIVFEDGFSIVLQVKRRRNDLVRIVHYTRSPYGLFDKVSKRFSMEEKTQLNVGAVTIYPASSQGP